jgi:mxaA protein
VRRALFIGLCAWFLLGADLSRAQGSDASEFQVNVTLRDSGYLLGDLLEERIEAHLPSSASIEADSLPLPGRVAPWLEVRRTRIERRQAQGSQDFVVTYQIFAEVDEARRVPLPAFKFRVRDGERVRVVDVPAQSFLLSPALPSSLTDEDRELRPSPTPQELPQRRFIAGALASFAGAIASAIYLLWRYDRLPFLPHAPGPLARAWRRWRRRKGELSDAEQTALLRDMHAALNGSAGETLYPTTLPRLFERAPYLLPLRAQIEALFGASWTRFYGAGDAASLPSASVLAMLRDAADRERGVPC